MCLPQLKTINSKNYKMDELFTCECGNDTFWYFGGLVRCPKCFNEYRQTGDMFWMRKWKPEEKRYGSWNTHYSTTYKDK